MQEKIIQTKQCTKCGTKFDITDKDLEFYKKVSPKFNGKTYEIPIPTLCPDCRQQRRLAWINKRKLYRGKCSYSGKPILSLYSPNSGYKIYDRNIRRSDKWDPMDYGQDFDFSKPFFEQFDKLMKKTPYPNLFIIDSENCEFNSNIGYSKNCYMCSGGSFLEDSYYVLDSIKVKNSSDIWWSGNIENCYECYSCNYLYKCFYCYDSNNCSNCYFLKDCNGCQDCIMCFGLQNARYCIKNKKYSPEEYKKKKEELELGNHNSLQLRLKEFKDFLLTKPHKFATIVNSENSGWDYIFNCKNCRNSFDAVSAVDSKYIYESGRVYDVRDGSTVYDIEGLVLEGVNVFDSFFVLFSEIIYQNCRNIIYSSNLSGCKDCFGCVGLRNKQYCILNKQYTKEEYEQLVPKIIEHMIKTGEWGQFFPVEISRFAYNETLAQEYFPLNSPTLITGKNDINIINDNGFKYKWLNKEYPVNIPEGMPTMKAEELPENIADLTEEKENKILHSAIICEVSGKPYRIIKQELEFYKKHNIPLPRKHPDVRHMERMKLRNPRKLYDRKCDKCGKDIKTTYSPDRPEIVYCQECYDKEVY